LKVYLLQFSPVWEDKEKNFEQVKKWIQSNKPSPNSLLVLPETFATGFSLRLDKTLPSEPQQTESFLKNLSLEYGIWVMGGMITPAQDSSNKGKNSVVLYSPDGTKWGSYEKVHLFNPSGEEKVHLPGNQVEVFEINGLKICPLICYDLRFPEVFREGTKNGAEVFVVHACWPSKRMNHWKVLLQARAIENQAYVIGSNRTGEEPETQYEGGSMVVDPQGNILMELGNEPICQEVVLENKLVDEWRASFQALPNWTGSA
jgi:omega-amidase